MKNLLLICLCLAGISWLQIPAVAAPALDVLHVAKADVHPAEAKYDKIMEKYVNGLKAAFAEKDDKKTIVMVRKLNDEMVSSFEKIKPEIESWIKGMTEADKEAFSKRAENKPYLKTIFTIMFDPEIGKRIEQNPELKAALDEGNARMKALGFEGEAEEESDY
ncbi:hypothetical protein H7F15_01870 [Pontibacter sp. Tf4]|uniref:hypothetical protein n=1 Tax=Pontibacter sp. Tf4 TaxID=2761620 RepID=UPI00162AC794|nr:hypothetical protein [Pontibacter sp. Tf4]MBB6609773.1 hypothetical protein [Pontibacter sp. Tf4]